MLSLYFLLFSKKSYQFPYFILIYITLLWKNYLQIFATKNSNLLK